MTLPDAGLAAFPEGADGGARTKWRWSHHLEILMVSMAVLLIEIAYTRIASYKLFYYYVYLVIGLALLGLGTGGVLVAISGRIRRAGTDAVLFWGFLCAAVATLAAYYAIAPMRVNTLVLWEYKSSGSVENFALLIALSVCVFASFVAPGVIIATLFGRRPDAIGTLYFADLLGASIACAGVIFLISDAGAPAAVMVATFLFSVGALRVAWRYKKRVASIAAVLVIVSALFSIVPGWLPTQQLDPSKDAPTTGLSASGWGPVFRVDAVHAGDVQLLFHDGILGAGIYQWNGTQAGLASFDFPTDPRSLPFSVLATPPTHEAVIGAAGGHEVLASLYYGAGHVDAVELNPVTVNMVEHTFANYDGHLAQNPRVTYTVADGRSFMARTNQHFQLVWYPAPDSYAATNGALSSAYVLSESYLYTTNGVQAMLQHLTNGGVFAAQFGEVDDQYDLRTTRFVATARQALANMGISDATDHIMVAETDVYFFGTIPTTTILVSRTPFTAAQRAGFAAAVQRVSKTVTLYAPGATVTTNPVSQYMNTPNAGLANFYNSFPFNVTPTTDNDPFFWHFARFGTVLSGFFHSIYSQDRENAVGERVLILLLFLSALIGALCLLAPFLFIRKQWRQLPDKTLSAVFFTGVGFGFIFFEVTLMQDLNLFLGYPTYAVTVVLMALLVFTGLGALLSTRIERRAAAIPWLLATVAALTVFYLYGMPAIVNAALSTPLGVRILLSVVMLAPLGTCLGLFMPTGLSEIAGHSAFPREYVAWGWAVNGFASVTGSALGIILSMIFGFRVVLIVALASYAVAVLAWVPLRRQLERAKLAREPTPTS